MLMIISLQYRARPFRSIKLMFVGDANKGKTTLLHNLTRRGGKMTHYTKINMGMKDKHLSTVGIDLGEYEYSPTTRTKPTITFRTWDFGGQVGGYNNL